jgi:hypothetical protein
MDMSLIDLSRVNGHGLVDALVQPVTTGKNNGVSTAMHLLEAARVMRHPADIRRNLVLARSALYDAISMIDHASSPVADLTPPPSDD